VRWIDQKSRDAQPRWFCAAGALFGKFNVGLGTFANYNNQSGDRNTIIGYAAGSGRAGYDRTGCVFIGIYAGADDTINNNRLYIENSNSLSPLIYGEFDNDIVAINGKLGINTNSPGEDLHVNGKIKILDHRYMLAK